MLEEQNKGNCLHMNRLEGEETRTHSTLEELKESKVSALIMLRDKKKTDLCILTSPTKLNVFVFPIFH